MERLTKDGLDRLVAELTERIGDPRVLPATECGYSLRRTVSHAIRGVEAYLDLAAGEPTNREPEASRAQAEELWAFLEQAIALLDRAAASTAARPRDERPPVPPAALPGCGPSSRATLTTARAGGGVLVMHLAGELDLGSADIFQEVPIEEAVAVAVDVSRLDFCDSTGLNALLRLRADAEEHGIQVHLAAPSEQVGRVLEITGADTVFRVHASIEDALAAVSCD